VSTHLPGDAADSAHPITEADLLDYFRRGAKSAADWRVGAEFEKFALDRTTGRQVTYAEPGGVRDVLHRLAERFGWEPHFEGDALTTLSRECPRGQSTVSLEPGAQVEFSTPPVRHIGELAAELHRHRDEVRAAADPQRVAWVGVGVSPVSRAEDIPPGPRPRHRVMAEYLPGRCPKAHHMMRATASTQVTFDYADEADAIRKVSVALTLSPVANAVWENSPFVAGQPSGWASYRGRIWQGMDPDRSGWLGSLLAAGFTFRRWIDYLLDVPMLFHLTGGAYHPAGGRTFRQFLAHGIDGRFPTGFDWELHVTTVFPEVRLKQFLEVRGADATPPDLALAVPAFWKGLLYDPDALAAAERVATHFPPGSLSAIAGVVHRRGLTAEVNGRPLTGWCRELATISADGLRRQAERDGTPDERPYLDPVLERLERPTPPPQSWPELLAACEY
jgi:glutamate--cysteine ligase